MACKVAQDCPGSDACGQRVCEKGICQIASPVESGALTAKNVHGDCQRITCDGKGNEITSIDNEDVPNDGDNCTLDVCTNGIPTNSAAPTDTPCGTVSGVTCNAAGACAGCSLGADCGVDTQCITWACDLSICVKKLTVVGTIVDNPVPGDCRKTICNALGETEEAIVPDDFPSDGNDCTTDACTLDGKEDHQPANIDTPCGTCAKCSIDGSCVACDTTVFDCYESKCIPKPQTCVTGSECPSTYCVDGYCCDKECAGACVACNEAKTGVPSGLCAPVINDTDPDNECNNTPTDSCWDGVCRCSNAKQDGAETGTDCGGACPACTGTWNCGGVNACKGGVTPKCCDTLGALCLSCSDKSQTCLSLEGTTCVVGTPSQVITLGTVGQSSCNVYPYACKFVECICK